MSSTRKIAVVAGVFFIVTAIAAIAGRCRSQSAVHAPAREALGIAWERRHRPHLAP